MARKKSLKAESGSGTAIYQLRIDLAETEVWRQIQVEDCDLGDLHFIIQSVMGWENCHMHQFRIGDDCYSLIDEYPGNEMDLIDSSSMTLGLVLNRKRTGFSFQYEYDFGDDWIHVITYEGPASPLAGAVYPLCIAGNMAGPPEDCGGPYAYAEILEVLADQDHEDFAEFNESYGPLSRCMLFDSKRATKDMGGRFPRGA